LLVADPHHPSLRVKKYKGAGDLWQAQMQPGGWLDESFEIKLRNHKKEAATVRVVEHLYRWTNWTVTQESAAHREVDSKTIEYEVTLQPDEERTLTYTAHYTW
jgi:hypothetical protein